MQDQEHANRPIRNPPRIVEHHCEDDQVSQTDRCDCSGDDVAIETPGWIERMLEVLLLSDAVGVVTGKVVFDSPDARSPWVVGGGEGTLDIDATMGAVRVMAD